LSGNPDARMSRVSVLANLEGEDDMARSIAGGTQTGVILDGVPTLFAFPTFPVFCELSEESSEPLDGEVVQFKIGAGRRCGNGDSTVREAPDAAAWPLRCVEPQNGSGSTADDLERIAHAASLTPADPVSAAPSPGRATRCGRSRARR